MRTLTISLFFFSLCLCVQLNGHQTYQTPQPKGTQLQGSLTGKPLKPRDVFSHLEKRVNSLLSQGKASKEISRLLNIPEDRIKEIINEINKIKREHAKGILSLIGG